MKPLMIAGALLVASAPGAAQRHDAVPEATPDGKALSCLSLMQIRETHVRSDRVIDFVTSGGRVYRNELPVSCPGLGSERRFSHRTSMSSYCSSDTITVLQSNEAFPGATCGLGTFQPVKLVKAP